MAGHSKWAGIKHKKAIIDAKRGKVFTKMAKEITVAARLGGGDMKMNPRLRTAVAKAKGVSMPGENIEKAIKKGTGELEGVSYEEITYEGTGSGGVAVIIDVMTDNRNRTVAEIRSIFTKAGGQLGKGGSVAWMFDRLGVIIVEKSTIGEEELMDMVLDAGAEDMVADDEAVFEVRTPYEELERVRSTLEEKGVAMQSAEIAMVPKDMIVVGNADAAKKLVRFMDTIEDHDDVQNVFANFDIPEEIVAELERS